MSRSIHTTRRHFYDEERFDYSDKEKKQERLDRMRESLWKKKQIKKQRKQERKFDPPEVLLEAVDPKTVDISFRDEGEFIHYPVTKEDVIALCKYLPRGILNGLDSITFCLGKEYQEEGCDYDYEPDCDPFTGRISSEIITGVHWAPVLRDKLEDYAERMAMEWAESAIIPFLKKAYPNNAEALALKADIFVHQEKYDDAGKVADKSLHALILFALDKKEGVKIEIKEIRALPDNLAATEAVCKALTNKISEASGRQELNENEKRYLQYSAIGELIEKIA